MRGDREFGVDGKAEGVVFGVIEQIPIGYGSFGLERWLMALMDLKALGGDETIHRTGHGLKKKKQKKWVRVVHIVA